MTRETTEEVTRKRWKQALDQLDQALLLAPTDRENLLNSIGQQDPELRQTVSQLLDANSNNESGNFMESPPWSYQPIESNPQVLVGKTVGAYKLTQYLAKGGMGIVYLAERADKTFRRRVAVKIINADTGLSLYNRFRREVQILADLNHPNLVLLYDAGRMGDGRPFLVMEYVEGETLRDWLIQRRSMTPAQTVEVIKQAAAGLHAAHEKGVIHRDIKPANIAVTESGDKLTVKVLDFGIAARKSQDGISVSSTKGAIGTLLYMSPEQLHSTKGSDLTPASDVYALGLTAYELLTGRPANDGQSQVEIMAKHLYETPMQPSKAGSGKVKIPPAIDGPVMKALAKVPADRYQSALEFAADLEAALVGKSPTALPMPAQMPNRLTEKLPVPVPAPKPITQPIPVPVPVQIEASKRKLAKPVAAIATGIIVVSSLVYWQSNKNDPPVTPQQTTPSPAATKLLKLVLTVDNTNGQPLADSSFALFNGGITKIPVTVTKENARMLRTDKSGKAESGWSVQAGTYLWKAVRDGYQTQTGEVTLREDASRPGTVKLNLTLEPK
ncbi:MAG: protein kinase [Acidobacteriota bacterium]|nr:protein kinase [Acidobacteriota bacterium]